MFSIVLGYIAGSGYCKNHIFSGLKKTSKKGKKDLDWEEFSFYICTPQERERS